MSLIREGAAFFPGYFSRKGQEDLVETLRDLVREAPFYTPVMPRSGRPLSVRMTNCGPLGWVCDRAGYRYQPTHPETGKPWPAMPQTLLDLWRDVTEGVCEPEACLINFYDSQARMGLHQDKDEEAFEAPVLSVSLGDECLFRIAKGEGKSPTMSLRLRSGDVLVLGGPARLAYHGVDRIYPATSTLLPQGGRINLTLRRVNPC